ncbi:hypothetical protein BG95_09005 [Thermosipho sp. 1063]|uniref:type III-A CRISPR-associated RAMP protein Csm5 n=1 Tax=unclassified Thermosipho (in: thermotogales) TaxID=2676525 RepID=UPI00094931BB|nr:MULTISPECIES: type III-A CRISPR-associated RAMP protein Csm5 [unclassified Thermosipho (in: thermotogales)]ANQ54697.1 hypothetical protein Y592_09110 [Thermosipho sp. 1070]APT73085.1 hypothetical protein BG95_09005 [Thermosipho sp. 1063]
MNKKISLKPLTILHIGSGEKLLPIFYVLRNNSYIRLKERSLKKLLKRHPEIKSSFYVDSRRLTVLKWEDYKNVLNDDDIWYICKKKFNYKIRGEVLENIKHPDGRFYIPGSSIKGSIRNGIMGYILMNNKNLRNKVEEKILNLLKIIKKNLNDATKILESSFRVGNFKDAKNDFLKFLKISDTNFTDKVAILALSVFVSNKDSFYQKNFNIFFEAILKNAEFESEVKFDEEGLKLFESKQGRFDNNLPRSLEDIFKMVDEFYRFVISKELEYIKNIKEKKEFFQKLTNKIEKIKAEKGYIMHIGYGGGLNAMSVFSVLSDNVKREFAKVITKHPGTIPPISRRYLIDEEEKPISPIGWIKVELR